jgi:hypothetical protein
MMVSELKKGQIANDIRGLIWYQPNIGYTTYTGPNSAVVDATGNWCPTGASTETMPCVATAPTGTSMYWASRSQHVGGVQTAMCDGAVRFFGDAIDINVWRALSSRAGGELIGEF